MEIFKEVKGESAETDDEKSAVIKTDTEEREEKSEKEESVHFDRS